jgi:hypothetical protein
MTSTPDLQPLGGCDDPASVLGYARDRRRAAAAEEREVAKAAAKWLSMHATGVLVGPLDSWHEQSLPLGGEGCPEVAEFCVAEFAAALGMSPDSGRALLTKYAEGFYRLTRCWARLDDGVLDAWRLRMIAERTLCLSPAAADFVDQHVAPVAHKIGPAQLMRLVEEAKARFDPEQAEADRQAAAEARHVDIDLATVGVKGTAHVDAALDLADALDLETAVADVARQLLRAGCTESLDVRRSMALGLLARGQTALPLVDGDTETSDVTTRVPPSRELVLHAHVSAAAVTGAAGAGGSVDLARVQEVLQAITVEQVRQWCGDPRARVTVKPILDLSEHIWVMSYEASERLRDQTAHRDGTCVHPFCTRPAVRCDSEHRVPHDPTSPERGPTCSCNQAPLCRRHHRAKTTGGWTYVTVEPGVYLWRSPLGYQYLRDHTGTLDVTPDADRRRYARELIAHFGDQPPET